MNPELFGLYTFQQARQDADTAILAFHNRRHITSQSPHCKHCTMRKLPPHIIIEYNDPSPDCELHDEHGRYTTAAGDIVPCLCRHLGRQPHFKEIQAEFN